MSNAEIRAEANHYVWKMQQEQGYLPGLQPNMQVADANELVSNNYYYMNFMGNMNPSTCLQLYKLTGKEKHLETFKKRYRIYKIIERLKSG